MHEKLLSYLLRLSQFAVWAGGTMILFSALLVGFDVVARRLFGFSIGGADEVSGYLFAIATVLAFPYALLHRSNVRIDALYVHLPRKLRLLLDMVGLILLGIFVAILTWRIFITVGVTWNNNSRAITPLQTPLILPQGIWLAGWIFFCITIALLIYLICAALWRGNIRTAERLGGARSVEEEAGEAAPLDAK